MSKFHQQLQVILTDVYVFLTETIKDVSMGSGAQMQKKQILNGIQKVAKDYPGLVPILDAEVADDDPGETYSEADQPPALPSHSRPPPTPTPAKVPPTSPTSTTSSSHCDYQTPPTAVEVIADVPASSLSNPVKAGFLGKEKKTDLLKLSLKNNQRRYCVIQDGTFYYYEKPESKKQNGAFRLADYEVAPVTEISKDGSQKQSTCVFQITCPGRRSYTFKANDYEDMKKWMEAIVKSSSVKQQLQTMKGSSAPAALKSPAATGDISHDSRDDVYDDTAEPTKDVYDETIDTRPPADDVYDDTGAGTAVAKPELSESSKTAALPPKPTPDAKSKTVAKNSTAAPSVFRLPPLPVPSPKEPDTIIDEEIYADVEDAPQELKPAAPSRPLPAPPMAPVAPAAQETITVRKDDYGNMYYGMWDCTASKDFELSFSKGEVLHVVSCKYEDKGWWTAWHNGKVGLVPRSYLTPAYVRV